MRLLWFAFDTRARRKRPWRVFIVDTIGAEKGGEVDPQKREIHIAADLTAARMAEIVAHELVHVMCYPTDPGAAELHQQSLDAMEEYVAQRVEETFWPVVAALGAHLPPFPPGFRPRRRRS